MTTGVGVESEFAVTRGAFTASAALSVAGGERLSILGPNGAGKSTLLAALAGTIPISRGTIRVGGRVLDAPGVRIAPQRRRVTLLDQRPRLFPHLSIRANIEFGVRAQGHGAAFARRVAEDWLERLDLADRGGARPHAISGGQQQRVAIARAFAAAPELLLLDEPFASLDAVSAPEIRRLLAEELARTGTTCVLVTHDLADAWQWSARCLVLDRGTVIADSSPGELAARPRHPFTAALAGFGVIEGVWAGDGLDAGGRTLPADADGDLVKGDRAFGVVEPRRVRAVVGEESGAVPGVVQAVSVHAGVVRVRHSSGLIAELDPTEGAGAIPATGDPLWVCPGRLRVLRMPSHHPSGGAESAGT